ncbi:MAG: hypothetical protein ACPGUC_10330 [Gammaproteobacteria bacterium]
MRLKSMFFGLGGLLLVSPVLISPVQATELCEAQGQNLAREAAERIDPPLSADQIQQLRRLAVSLCDYQSEATGYIPAAPEGYADWFSWFMLNGNPDKAGNRRLKNLKR